MSNLCTVIEIPTHRLDILGQSCDFSRLPMAQSSSPILIGGTIAIDHVKTPDAEAANLLGGSAAYAALAASFYTRPVSLIGIIGHDFPQQHLAMLESRGISSRAIWDSPYICFPLATLDLGIKKGV